MKIIAFLMLVSAPVTLTPEQALALRGHIEMIEQQRNEWQASANAYWRQLQECKARKQF